MDSPSPLIGQLVDGHYLVHSLLGEGGMGRVYRAEEIDLDREVALKTVLLPPSADATTRRERFHREARAASRINHPGVVQTFGFGTWRGLIYIAMELVEGPSLADFLDQGGPVPSARAAQILIDTCDAVHAAHAVGVLHRDLKPENIMLARGADGIERVKVVDFGLALVMASTDERLTQEGLVMGTPAYISPEQARAEVIDERADVYSLGIVLYEILCGRPPFLGNTAADVVVKHCYEDPPLPSALAPDIAIAEPLEAAALWALAKEPKARPQTAAAFADELREALRLIEAGAEDPLRHRKRPLPAGDRAARAAAIGLDPVAPDEVHDARSKAATHDGHRRHHPQDASITPRPKDKGLVPTSPAPRQGGAPEVPAPIVVCELPAGILLSPGRVATPPTERVSISLRAGGHEVHPTSDLSAVTSLAEQRHASIAVIDIRPDPEVFLEQLRDILPRDDLALIVVGPDDDLALMTRALEIGVADFIPASIMTTKLAKRVTRLLRRQHRAP